MPLSCGLIHSPVTSNVPDASCLRNTTRFPRKRPERRIRMVPGVMLLRSLVGLCFCGVGFLGVSSVAYHLGAFWAFALGWQWVMIRTDVSREGTSTERLCTSSVQRTCEFVWFLLTYLASKLPRTTLHQALVHDCAINFIRSTKYTILKTHLFPTSLQRHIIMAQPDVPQQHSVKIQ